MFELLAALAAQDTRPTSGPPPREPPPSFEEYRRRQAVLERVFNCDGERYVITSVLPRRIDGEPILGERLVAIRVGGLVYDRNLEEISDWFGGLSGWADVRIDCSESGFALHAYGARSPGITYQWSEFPAVTPMEWRTAVFEGYDVIDMIVTPAGVLRPPPEE